MEYKVTPKEKFVIYGININKLTEMKFRDIEKDLNCETEVDSEMAVVLIKKDADFVQKTKETPIKDYIYIMYAVIEDLSIYKNYKDISPNKVYFFGKFSINEDSNIKKSIIRELEKNLPDNDTSRQIVKDIREKFILGDFDDDLSMRINFNMPKFPYAEFVITFRNTDRKDLFYKYIFSMTEDPYPY